MGALEGTGGAKNANRRAVCSWRADGEGRGGVGDGDFRVLLLKRPDVHCCATDVLPLIGKRMHFNGLGYDRFMFCATYAIPQTNPLWVSGGFGR